MTAQAEAGGPTDAELVAGVLAGDREAFAAVYDRYADRLHDFCASVLRDRHEAADAVQDTFVLVAERLGQLNDPDRLRPWLYAVARSVALRRTRARKRIVLDAEVSEMADTDAEPQRAAEQAALRDLVWSAAAGLSERDRALLDLHLRQGLDGSELGEAMGVSTGHAYVLLTRLRDQVERSLGALLIARLGRKDCPELDGMLAGWDGRFSPLLRKRVARHVDSCEVCGDRRRIMVSPIALLTAIPLIPAPLYLRDQVLERIELVAASRSTPKPSRSRLPIAAAAAALLLVGGGVAAYWTGGSDDTPGVPLAQSLPSTTASTTGASGTTTASSASPTASTTSTSTTTTTTRPSRPLTTTTNVPQPPPPPPPDTTPPRITSQEVGNRVIYILGSNCSPNQTTVRATVVDNVGLASVRLSWTDPNGKPGTASMALQGGQWQATLGPFSALGSVVWRISATDTAGNTRSGAEDKIAVERSCIG